MQKRLTFDDAPAGRQLFVTLWDGITWGASDGKGKDRERRGAIAKIQRKLVAVSDPVEKPDFQLRPMNARVVKVGPQEVLLYGAEVSLINDLLSGVAWGGASILDVADLDDALGQMPDVDASEKG